MDIAVSVDVTCRECGNQLTLTLPQDGYARFLAGEAAQTAMPDVSEDDRELLISGMCAACWAKLVSDVEDELYEEEKGDEDDADGGDEGEATAG